MTESLPPGTRVLITTPGPWPPRGVVVMLLGDLVGVTGDDSPDGKGTVFFVSSESVRPE